MAQNAPRPIRYEETRELALLERVLQGRRWGLGAVVAFVCSALAISLALFHLYTALNGTPETRSFRSMHLTVMFLLAILLNPLFRKSVRDPIWKPGERDNVRRTVGFVLDLAMVALGIGIQVYTLWDIEAFNARGGRLLPTDLWIGSAMLVLVLEATRRTVGLAMVIITSFFIAQSLFSDRFPGIFFGPPTPFQKYIDVIFMRPDGIFGIPLMVVATYIVLFIIFGSLLIRSGAGKFFIDLAVALTGRRVGGPAKASVVSSGFMGTVSGSAVANVVTTGSFTIPLMKRLGYRPKFAAAVEACASSGGQITPPILGAAAFIIAEFLQVNYLTVVLASTIPAFLYFATVYFMVHLEAEKHAIPLLSEEQLPRIGKVMRGGWHLLFSLLVLLTLMVVGFTPMMAAFWSIVALVALSFISPLTRMSPVDILAALESGVRNTIPVTIACACAGIIIGSVFASGVGLKFTQSVIDLSGGNLMVLLVLTAVASIVLGMGLTTTAVYITLAALVIPSIERMGVSPMAAHMFAFYFGVVSTITPPVALASFAAAGIAGTPPMATAVESSKVGIAKFLVPFIFVYNPTLLFEGPLWLTGFSAATALVGVWVLSMAMEAWMKGPASLSLRALLLACAVLLLWPPQHDLFGVSGLTMTLVGAGAAFSLYASRLRATRVRVAVAGV
jgi:TRAP transporter 4TM/12TM fusion protein